MEGGQRKGADEDETVAEKRGLYNLIVLDPTTTEMTRKKERQDNGISIRISLYLLTPPHNPTCQRQLGWNDIEGEEEQRMY